MLLIRRFEERTEEQYTRARIGGYCHLAIGEEAANVGAIEPMEPGDYVLASYRDHGTALAVGSEPHRVMAELFGKATGVAGGYGGSMHLLDVERHFLGGWGIVGGQLPIAVGVALALDYESKPNAVLVPARRGRDQHRRLPRVAQPGRDLAPADRLPGHQQPLRHGHVRRDGLGRARAVEARSGLPHARRARRRQRPAGGARGLRPAPAPRPRGARAGPARDDDLPLPRALGGRRGQGLPRRRRGRRGARSTIRSTASWPSRASTPRPSSACAARSTPRSTRPSARRPPIPRRIPTNLFDNVYGDPDWREQFAPMARGGPFGEREGTRSWRA